MSWLKRNLFFVVGGGIALLLMVGAAYFLFTKIQEDSQVSNDLNAQVELYRTLSQEEPHPDETNYNAVKLEKNKLNDFVSGAKRYFLPVSDRIDVKDVRYFLAFLENTIADLQEEATNATVTLPANYAFTFANLRGKPNLKVPTFEPWITQFKEIKAICEVLFAAKVNGLEGIRRVPAGPQDVASLDILPTTMGTNNTMNAIFTPYEFAFRAFSSELASAMDGFIRASNCFIIKSINVEPSKYIPPAPAAVTVAPVFMPGYVLPPTPPPGSEGRSGGMSRALMERYGLTPGGRRPGSDQPGMVAPPSNPFAMTVNTNVPPGTALTERLLRVVVLIEVVKFRSASN